MSTCLRFYIELKRTFTRAMASFSVLVTRPDIPAIDILEKRGYQVSKWTKKGPMPREALLKEIAGKNALLCVVTDEINSEVLDSAGSSLKVISTMSVGYDHLDVAEIRKRNIKIGFTPDVLTDAVAELTLGLLIATSRRFFESHQAIINSEWPFWSPLWMCGMSLKDSVVGIVGFGRIGQKFAELLQPFGVSKILYTSRKEKPEGKTLKAEFSTFENLVSSSDFVVVTCALTPETKELFNMSVFNKMKPTSIFINTSRGGIVNQEDLIEALKTGKIGSAGLDVMTPEPIQPNHELLKLKNCVILPHIGSASSKTRFKMGELAANNVVAALENRAMPAALG